VTGVQTCVLPICHSDIESADNLPVRAVRHSDIESADNLPVCAVHHSDIESADNLPVCAMHHSDINSADNRLSSYVAVNGLSLEYRHDMFVQLSEKFIVVEYGKRTEREAVLCVDGAQLLAL
jgi:hypothetical protein